MELETDDKGIVTFLPMIEWAVTIVQDKDVGLAVDYFANAEDLAAQRLSRIQLYVNPAVARQIGRAMQTRADMVIAAQAGKPVA
jgi:hypothetical protein